MGARQVKEPLTKEWTRLLKEEKAIRNDFKPQFWSQFRNRVPETLAVIEAAREIACVHVGLRPCPCRLCEALRAAGEIA